MPITHEKMTRFWISLQEGVDFVLNCFERMHGGEIFIPKIPSVRIVDLANAMAPDLPLKIIGIRPGEKLHETMCPSDDSHLTIEFDSYFVIKPSIRFYSENHSFYRNLIDKEEGKDVEIGFKYSSGKNPHFLNKNEIVQFNEKQ